MFANGSKRTFAPRAAASLVLNSIPALAQSSNALTDLASAQGAGGETDLGRCGDTHIDTIKTSSAADGYCRNNARQSCVRLTTRDGRYQAFVDVDPSDCVQTKAQSGMGDDDNGSRWICPQGRVPAHRVGTLSHQEGACRTHPWTGRALNWALGLSALWLAACATTAMPSPNAPDSPLAGTQWQLVAIQSMSDEQGITRPSDPSSYTLAFGPEGRASLRLDCNRGSVNWQANAATGDTPGRRSGNLVFGALASTRAMCAPGSLEPRMAKALPFVRSYLLMDGRLHLSLLADGGILVFAPAPRPPN